MRWHIVCALIVMHIIRIIFLHRFIKIHFEILTYSRVCIFIDGKTCLSMLDKYLKNTCPDFPDLRESLQYLFSDEMKSAPSFAQLNSLLKHFHIVVHWSDTI